MDWQRFWDTCRGYTPFNINFSAPLMFCGRYASATSRRSASNHCSYTKFIRADKLFWKIRFKFGISLTKRIHKYCQKYHSRNLQLTGSLIYSNRSNPVTIHFGLTLQYVYPEETSKFEINDKLWPFHQLIGVCLFLSRNVIWNLWNTIVLAFHRFGVRTPETAKQSDTRNRLQRTSN